MAEARITEFFGETQIREEVLDFMGLGLCMPREAWRLPSPQPLHFVEGSLCGDPKAMRWEQGVCFAIFHIFMCPLGK